MNFVLAFIALAVLGWFLGTIVSFVPEFNLIAVIVIAFLLAAADFVLTIFAKKK